MAIDPWDPRRYEYFRDERGQPFFDLAELVHMRPKMRVLDLGCGNGRWTRWLHKHVAAARTLGIDSSPEMLADAEHRADPPRLTFARADISGFLADERFDLVFSNAALHWLPDHAETFPKIFDLVAPRGQIAVQMPSNFAHPAYRLAARVAAEPPFAGALGGWIREDPVLAPEDYAAMLQDAGFGNPSRRSPHVRLLVYIHELDSTRAVLEWLEGGLLTAYRSRMDPELYEEYLKRYATALREELGDQRPYVYTFRRLFLWGLRTGA